MDLARRDSTGRCVPRLRRLSKSKKWMDPQLSDWDLDDEELLDMCAAVKDLQWL